MTNKTLVVLSGGQDSTICLYLAKQQFDEIHCLTFDYNQRHKIEIESAKKIANLAGVASHEILELGPILKSKSFLTNDLNSIQEFNSFKEMNLHNSLKEDKLDSSFVPLRNDLFLSIAANRAVYHNCNSIITGITAADFAEYGEFSWEWLGGFVDAEGNFSTVNKNGWRLNISQKDPEMLDRLVRWIQTKIDDFNYGLSIDKKDCAELTIGKLSGIKLLEFLSPHLHSTYRRNQALSRGIQLLPETDLTMAYVTGFWEGDGSCFSQDQILKKKYITHSFHFLFFQKDPEVLEKISNYLKCGTIYQRNTQNKAWVLTISDGPKSQKLLRKMRPHFNVLGSFEKIAKYRHKINCLSGGFNPPYPDCSPDYLFSVQKSINEALTSPFIKSPIIQTPLLYLTKAQSIWLANRLPGALEALSFSHTCYDGKFPPCGKCHSCLLRQYGFLQAGIKDPLMRDQKQMFDESNVKYAVGRLLKSFGEDLNREGLEDTPDRVAKAWEFWLSGYGQNPKDVLKDFKDGGEKYDELVFEGNIPCYSHCEHHLTAFFGVVHIGYIATGKIVGLSKLARLVEIYSRRLQVQERLTTQISTAVNEVLQPKGTGVVIRCRHLCLESRGVQKPGAVTYTSSMLGVMRDDQLARSEFLQFVNLAETFTKSI